MLERERVAVAGFWVLQIEIQLIKVKYGKLNDKLCACLPGGGQKLTWSLVYPDFFIFCIDWNFSQESFQKTSNWYFLDTVCCAFKTLCNIYNVRKKFNIGFNTPRSDQCNDCALIQKWINESKEENKKKKLQYFLIVEWSQDFMFWMFQKSYAQQGKDYQKWESLELHREYIE